MNRIVQRQGAAPPWIEFQSGKFVLATRLPSALTSHDVT